MPRLASFLGGDAVPAVEINVAVLHGERAVLDVDAVGEAVVGRRSLKFPAQGVGARHAAPVGHRNVVSGAGGDGITGVVVILVAGKIHARINVDQVRDRCSAIKVKPGVGHGCAVGFEFDQHFAVGWRGPEPPDGGVALPRLARLLGRADVRAGDVEVGVDRIGDGAGRWRRVGHEQCVGEVVVRGRNHVADLQGETAARAVFAVRRDLVRRIRRHVEIRIGRVGAVGGAAGHGGEVRDFRAGINAERRIKSGFVTAA